MSVSGSTIGGGVITTGHDEAWDVSGLGARVNVWHHVALVYDSDTVHFYLDGQRTTDQQDHGDLVSHATDVVIGQAGQGSDHEYFTGMIDEVKIFSRALGHEEVLEVFRSTIHNGGHCENGADHSHCDVSNGDGNFDSFVVIDQLSPATSYDVYCMPYSLYGTKSELHAVLRKNTTASTACTTSIE